PAACRAAPAQERSPAGAAPASQRRGPGRRRRHNRPPPRRARAAGGAPPAVSLPRPQLDDRPHGAVLAPPPEGEDATALGDCSEIRQGNGKVARGLEVTANGVERKDTPGRRIGLRSLTT